MRVVVEIGESGAAERWAEVRIAAAEIARVHLNLSQPDLRNRSEHYLRRHPGRRGDVEAGEGSGVPPKLTIPEHLREMRAAGRLPAPGPVRREGDEVFGSEPAMLVVTVSDLTANLLRPSWHRDGLGPRRLFHFAGEPIAERSYSCLCFIDAPEPRLTIREVRFDPAGDRALDVGGPGGADAGRAGIEGVERGAERGLLDEGLVWTAALVPLVAQGRALPAEEIARRNYDLRQMLGRDESTSARRAYEAWPQGWDERVAEAVAEHRRGGRPFASFYHGVLALDGEGGVVIRQLESPLPELAEELAREGFAAAGLLDSGGSCALYDPWLPGYLNRGWYFREPRGAVLVFELRAGQRLDERRLANRAGQARA